MRLSGLRNGTENEESYRNLRDLGNVIGENRIIIKKIKNKSAEDILVPYFLIVSF